MCSDEWLNMAFYTRVVALAVSTLFNFILIHFLRSTPRKAFGNYKYLMMMYSVTGIFYSICNILIRPNALLTGHSYYLFSTLTLGTPKYLGTIGIAVYCSCYGTTLALLGIQFFYRYTSVTAPPKLAIFSMENFPGWGLIVLLYAAISGFTCYFLLGPNPRKDVELAGDMLKLYCLASDEYTYIGAQYFHTDTPMPLSIGGTAILAAIMLITFAFVIYFGIGIYRTLTEDGLTCFASRELQKQFFQTLVLQTLIPFCLMYIPIILLFLLPLLPLRIEMTANVITISMVAHLCFQPIVAIYYIKSFKLRVYNFVTCYKHERKVCALPLSLTDN